MRESTMRGVVVWMVLAVVAAAQGRLQPVWSNDVRELRAAVRREPDNLGLQLRLARSLLRDTRETARPSVRRAHAAESERLLEAILKKAPDARVPLEIMALVEARAGNRERALGLARRALANYPGDPAMARLAVRCCVQLGRHEEAAQHFVDWVRTGAVPSFGQGKGVLSVIVRVPEVRRALEEKLAAAAQDPKASSDVHLYRAAFVAELGRLEEAWRLVHAAEAAGACNLRNGDRPFVVTVLKEKGLEPGVAPGVQAGTDPAALREAIAAHPDHAGLRMRLGRVLFLRDDHEGAIAAYDAALARGGDTWTVHQMRGQALARLERWEEAAAAFRQAAARLPDAHSSSVGAAMALARSGRGGEAMRALLPFALRYAPSALSRAAIEASVEGGQAEKVLAEWQAQWAQHKQNPYFAAHYALALLAAGRKSDAQFAARAAEKAGMEGPQGYPAAVLWQAYERTPPAALLPPSER